MTPALLGVLVRTYHKEDGAAQLGEDWLAASYLRKLSSQQKELARETDPLACRGGKGDVCVQMALAFLLLHTRARGLARTAKSLHDREAREDGL